MKQQSLKEQRDYNKNPRRVGEHDPDHRNDMGQFEDSQTVQSEAEACDINNIMKKYTMTGQLPQMINTEPSYGDFSDVPSFQEALGIVAHANAQFYALDARVRARFDNDPGKMLEFVNDPDNAEEMVKLGLAVPRVEKEDPMQVFKDIRENTKPRKTKQEGQGEAGG